MKTKLLSFIFTLLAVAGYSQAYFTSRASGDWNSPANWTLVSGTSPVNYPAAGDSVIILNGHNIQVVNSSQCQSLTVKDTSALSFTVSGGTLNVSNDLLITELSAVGITAGQLTVTGNVTINQKSAVTQSGGAISIIGLVFLNAPTASAGNTTLNIDQGAFSCIGGITITATTLPAGRVAELKIGNSAVTVAGALTTISANAKITFTGAGVLTLAGIISIFNPASFSAGNGRVVYVGIPGSNQSVAPLTYNRLVITGVGNGSKTISGNVTVTDTLTLLSDTLQITGGTLTLNNNATIVKTAGKIISTPTFLGQIDLLYNDVQKDTTGLEMPATANVLRNLFINNILGVTLGASVTVNNKLSLQNGELFTGNFMLNISNAAGGTTTDPAIERINGYVKGRMSRTIGTSAGVRIFPLGIGLLQGYRECKIDYITAPAAAGTLSVQHFNSAAPAQSGLPLTDGAVIISNTAPYYWQADAASGLSGGSYNVALTAEGTQGVTGLSTLRILKRPSAGGSWVLDGTAGTNSGTSTAPVVIRNGLSGFSQFTIGGNAANQLPLTLLSFTGVVINTGVELRWKTTRETNTAHFDIEKSSNGLNFITIGKTDATAGYAIENNYQYKDESVVGNKYYYRLKMVDKDGRFTYSPVILVTAAGAGLLSVYPTVTQYTITVVNNTGRACALYNAGGQYVKALVIGVNDIGNLPAGLYTVSTGTRAVRIILQ
jgi:hypothetical protein